MKRFSVIFFLLMMSVCTMSGRTYQRAKTDTLSSYVVLPRGTVHVSRNPEFAKVVADMFGTLEESGAELVKIVVSGSSSPDGLWGNNIALSKGRTDAAVAYLKSVKKIPSYKILAIDLMEDWGGLEKMVASSDLPHKDEVLEIIRTKTWGERKTALKELDGRNVWSILEKEYFPKLRSVRLDMVYKGSVSKPALCPDKPKSVVDTVYVTDTVYVYKEVCKKKEESVQVFEPVDDTPEIPLERVSEASEYPWMFGIKTNLLMDAAVVPTLGIEMQLSRHLSLDLQSFATKYNVLVPSDENVEVFGISPEIRWWFGDGIMSKGSFIGLHANVLWYSLQLRNGRLYQSGSMDMWNDGYYSVATSDPAWMAGLTYGYSLGLGKEKRWGLEFVVGAGYLSVGQNAAERDALGKWQLKEHQNLNGISITKLGVNLTYRFAFKKHE